MSGLEVVGLVVGVVPVLFQTAGTAWKTLDDTITFSDDTEDLGIRLETAKAHLGLWASKAGVIQGRLLDDLIPYEELIERTLRRICSLIENAEREGSKYGIVVKEMAPSHDVKRSGTVMQISRSFHSAMTNLKGRSTITSMLVKDASASRVQTNSSSVSRRILWAVHDRKKFEEFVESLERHVRGLRAFVSERENKAIRRQGTRLVLDVIQEIEDSHSLVQLQNTSNWDEDFSQIDIHALAQWKIIGLQRSQTPLPNGAEVEDYSLDGSTVEDRSGTRFLKKGRIHSDIAYLFEKKNYDSNISDAHKDLLRERVRQLVTLLTSQRAQNYLHTLQPLGYIDDPDYHCWWIVFRFPLSPLEVGDLKSNQPLSLRKLLALPSKPALETRYSLASMLVGAFASLYGGQWMHKGINSTNVIFPYVDLGNSAQVFTPIHKALLQGFNYSRQLTQTQTIDQGKVLDDLEAAIYRHPQYQGEAASGYQIHYDIYSLGLVLFEIATWGPIMDILAAKPLKDSTVALSRNMQRFHEAEALELKRKVMIKVKYELAYRVGTKYKEAVDWCLNLKHPVTAVEFYDRVAIPLEDVGGRV